MHYINTLNKVSGVLFGRLRVLCLEKKLSFIIIYISCIFIFLSGCLSQVQENKEVSKVFLSPRKPLKSFMIDKFQKCPLTYRRSDLSYESIHLQNKLCGYKLRGITFYFMMESQLAIRVYKGA